MLVAPTGSASAGINGLGGFRVDSDEFLSHCRDIKGLETIQMRKRLYAMLIAGGLSVSACDAQQAVVDSAVGSAAEDQIEVYDIAKKGGDKMQACAQAGMIAQLFLQSKDESRWKEWKDKETADCKEAGMPTG